MSKVVTMGEIMLRLSPPSNQRFIQASRFDINFGGSEANVAVTLSSLGHRTTFVSKVPSNPIGDCAIQTLMGKGVDCTHIKRGGERLGIYFLENGASVRPSRVVYDRLGSAISEANITDFDFDSILKDADLFHISGITPIISRNLALLTIEAVKVAKKLGVTVSLDLNYRSKLWSDSVEDKQNIMSQIMEYTDICFGNALDVARCMGYKEENIDFTSCKFEECVNAENMAKVVKHYDLKYLITTLRNNISASDNNWSAAVSDGSKWYQGKEYGLHIVDRVGGGDAFTAGFLHSFLEYKSMEDSLEFAIATAAIKHTIPGDLNYTTVEEIENLVKNGGSARVIR